MHLRRETARRHAGLDVRDEIRDALVPAEGRALEPFVPTLGVAEARVRDRDPRAVGDLLEADGDLRLGVRTIELAVAQQLLRHDLLDPSVRLDARQRPMNAPAGPRVDLVLARLPLRTLVR